MTQTVVGWADCSLTASLLPPFVLHGVEQFKTWHASHHERPVALISAPTAMSAALITVLVFGPGLMAGTFRSAVALTLGVTIGYFIYALCHHASHHWRAHGRWLKERKRWHAIHHRSGGGECYGVTFMLWDRVFGTAPQTRKAA